MSIDPNATKETLDALVPGFLANRQNDVKAIRKALVSEDFEIIANIGHKLRGNGATFGFPDLSKVGEQIELAARARDHDRVLRESDALEKRVGELVLDLRLNE
ncbi:MAG TPA: Hpt domain-containing protein, partial [Polyangiaceae bacterium]